VCSYPGPPPCWKAGTKFCDGFIFRNNHQPLLLSNKQQQPHTDNKRDQRPTSNPPPQHSALSTPQSTVCGEKGGDHPLPVNSLGSATIAQPVYSPYFFPALLR
jgi:hypothetical protein